MNRIAYLNFLCGKLFLLFMILLALYGKQVLDRKSVV